MKNLNNFIIEKLSSNKITKENINTYTSKKGMNDEIKTWYHKTYPSDSAYEDIEEKHTFKDVLEALVGVSEINNDPYFYLGDDSVIRERVFEQISKLCSVDYDIIYYLWLDGE